ncbi:GCG_CRPN prefix-to-repeats domain-containing protein [Methylobacterium trifolii]|uniref:Sulfur globule protein n=1 Tax=Methylobacterium trifolii TaxID=1003092 RepID=A0ABQ4TZE6_9HYPH|nr:hypothetical protein [Methylobacterium trifolii]GJE59929.1 hypothetical protein MPOCJGCO_2036 [Methylobacterium trifolii]
MMLSRKIGIAALVAGTLGLASSASAAPLSPARALALAGDAVETVAYGCGPGFAPNAWGHCRPMYRRSGYYGPRRYYGPPAYARPVFHVGPYGAGLSFY